MGLLQSTLSLECGVSCDGNSNDGAATETVPSLAIEDQQAEAVETNINEERQGLLVLAAKWSGLGRRLRKLANASLEDLMPKQFADAGVQTDPPAAPSDTASEALSIVDGMADHELAALPIPVHVLASLSPKERATLLVHLQQGPASGVSTPGRSRSPAAASVSDSRVGPWGERVGGEVAGTPPASEAGAESAAGTRRVSTHSAALDELRVQEIQQRMKAESASRELETARQAHEQEVASLRAELEKVRTEARDNAVAAEQARRRTKHAMHQFRKMQEEVRGLWLVAVAVRSELPLANACSHCCIVAPQLVGLADDEQSDEEWRYALATQ